MNELEEMIEKYKNDMDKFNNMPTLKKHLTLSGLFKSEEEIDIIYNALKCCSYPYQAWIHIMSEHTKKVIEQINELDIVKIAGGFKYGVEKTRNRALHLQSNKNERRQKKERKGSIQNKGR